MALSSCAELAQWQIDNTCSSNIAYTTGVNDGKSSADMKTNYASVCPTHQAVYNAEYQKGYQFGLRQYSRKTDITINNNIMRKPKWKFCLKDAFGDEYCGLRRGDNCIRNNFGEIKCGLRCSVNNVGNISCAKERYSNR